MQVVCFSRFSNVVVGPGSLLRLVCLLGMQTHIGDPFGTRVNDKRLSFTPLWAAASFAETELLSFYRSLIALEEAERLED